MFCTCCGQKLKTKKGKCRICKQEVTPLKSTNGYDCFVNREKKKGQSHA